MKLPDWPSNVDVKNVQNCINHTILGLGKWKKILYNISEIVQYSPQILSVIFNKSNPTAVFFHVNNTREFLFLVVFKCEIKNHKNVIFQNLWNKDHLFLLSGYQIDSCAAPKTLVSTKYIQHASIISQDLWNMKLIYIFRRINI